MTDASAPNAHLQSHHVVAVVGAGQAAVQLAVSLRQDGFAGRIVLLNGERWLPYQRPPLSKAFMIEGWEPSRTLLRPESFYEGQGIERRDQAVAVAVDPVARVVVTATGERVTYDRLVLATGVEARLLNVPGADLPHVHYLRTLDDALVLRERAAPGVRAVVIGAGYIGLEVAATLTKLGASVTVVEAQPRAMSRTASEPVSTFFAAEHRSRGVDLRFGAGVDAIRQAAVHLTDGSAVPADLVVAGIGVLPADRLAREAGIACENGILVDAGQRTSDPFVFAVGDCCNVAQPGGGRLRLESVASAIAHGKAAARALMGLEPPKAETPWFWSDQYDLKLQIAGLVGRAPTVLVRGEPASRKFSVLHLDGDRLAAIECINAPRDFMASKALIAQGARLDRARAADPDVALPQALI